MKSSQQRIRFIKTSLRALQRPASGYRIVWDTETSGLGLRITSTGTRSFIYRYSRKCRERRITIGHFPSISIDVARRQVAKLAAKVADDRDPVAERQQQEAEGVALRTVLEAYLSARPLKASTRKDMRVTVGSYFEAWLPLPVKAITPAMVEKRHKEIGERSQAQANLSMRYLRALMNFAATKWSAPDGTPLLTYNPVKRLTGIKAWYRVERRRTLLKEHEVKAWWAALEALSADLTFHHGPEFADYHKLLLLTGLRRMEALSLQWENIDFQARTLTVPDTKNHVPHALPLSDYLQAMLEARMERAHGKSVFNGPDGVRITNFRYAEHFIAEHSGTRITPHDLRRSFATFAEQVGIGYSTLKRLLNHKQGNDVTAAYLVISIERLRDPMQRITDFVLKAAGKKEAAAVLPLVAAQ